MRVAPLVVAATVAWIAVLIALALVKAAHAPDVPEAIRLYLIHFTNWSWTLAIVFFSSTLCFGTPAPRPGDDPATRTCCTVREVSCVTAWCFFPLNAAVWFVAIAVFVLLLTDPAFITDIFMNIEPGIVMVANDIFHLVPVIALLFFVLVHTWLLVVGVRQAYAACGWFFIVWSTVLGPLVLIGTWHIPLLAYGLSAMAVYGTNLSIVAAIAAFVGVGIIANGTSLCVLNAFYGVTRPSRTPRYDEYRAMLRSDEEIFGKDVEDMTDCVHKHIEAAATAIVTKEPVAPAAPAAAAAVARAAASTTITKQVYTWV